MSRLAPAAGADTSLEVDRLRIVFGGKVAVDGATLSAPVGQITGLIGPNGAGKTSILNACNGLLKPDGGTVRLFGRDVTNASISARARAGLGRTFQTAEICQTMTVRANVSLGAESRFSGANPLRQLASGPKRLAEVAADADHALRACGIADLGEQPAATLSTGQQRLVELARVVAGGFRLLLLDEPSSGLDERESLHLGRVLDAIVDRGRRGVLIVEHDIALVMAVCDYIYVLDFGHVIFGGTPDETRASPAVRAAYLGPDREAAVGRR